MPTASRSIDEAATLAGWQALSLKSWLIGVSLIIGAWLVSGFYLVDAQQRGVLSRFGQIVSVSDPGWHWRWPYPFETVRLINVEGDRTIEVGLTEQKGRRQSVGLMSTADGNLVNVAFAIVYQVRDPVAYLSKAEVPADLLVLTVEDQLRDVMSRQTLSDVLGSAKQQPTPILKPALASMRSQVESALATLDLGIEIKGIEVREVRLPAAVLSAAKEADRDVQAALRSLRERQGAATEGLIKAYKLSGELGEESAGYVSGLESASRVLTSGSANTDAAALSTTFIELIGGLRQQYPLAFASLADLQQRVSPAAANRDGAKASDKITDIKTAPEAPSAVDWRDRELMRSRDRVDRPGSGS
jgi:regulator of protease activity HflC (stomatin/prohibitin superfamily)